MNGDLLLDTNIVIAVFRPDQSVLDRLPMSEQVCVCPPVVAELYYGAAKSRSIKRNVKRIDDFVKHARFLPCDLETAQIFGSVRYGLHVKGRPIPENDIWIASTAMQHDLVLITRDAHFSEIEGLQIESW